MGNFQEKNSSKDRHLARLAYQVFFSYFHFFTMALAVIIILLGLIFVIRPKYALIQKDIAERVTMLQSEKDTLDLNKVKIDGYKKSYTLVNARQLERLEIYLPLVFDRDAIFAQMEAIVKGRGYTLDKITLSEAESEVLQRGQPSLKGPMLPPPAGVGTLVIELDVSYINYRGLKSLLGVFENSLRLYDVVGLDFSPESSKAALKIQAYYLL